jgi:hypothetical protein
MDGILYIALGAEYDFLAAHTVAKTRENTDLPITVVSNMTLRHPKWDEVPNIHFIDADIPQEHNRIVKTLMGYYTPFNRTLFIDSDAFVQRAGVEECFGVLGHNDMALYHYRAWRTNKVIPRIMARALDTFGMDVPIQEYFSGCFCFTTNTKTDAFFNDWHAAWHKFGCGRDMPAFSCMLKQHHANGLKSGRLTKQHCAVQWLDSEAIIQHDPNNGFPPEYGIPKWVPWRVPSDKPGEFQRIERRVR